MNRIEMSKRVKFPLGDGTYQVVRIAVVDNNAHRMFGYNPLTNSLEDMSDLEVVGQVFGINGVCNPSFNSGEFATIRNQCRRGPDRSR